MPEQDQKKNKEVRSDANFKKWNYALDWIATLAKWGGDIVNTIRSNPPPNKEKYV